MDKRVKDNYFIYSCKFNKEGLCEKETLIFSSFYESTARNKLQELRKIEKELLQGTIFKLVEKITGEYASWGEGISKYWESEERID